MGGDRRGARPGSATRTRAGPALEDGAAAPVPRHPAGLLDRLGAPRGAGRPTRGSRRSWRRSSTARWRALAGDGRRRRAGLQRRAARTRRACRPAGRGSRLRQRRAEVAVGAPARAAVSSWTTACSGSRSTSAAWSCPRTTSRPSARRSPPGRPRTCSSCTPTSPTMWDAWDVDAFYRNTVTDLTDARRARRRRRARSRVVRTFGDSRVTQPAHAPDGRPAARHRHRGRLARDGEVPQGGLPARRAGRPVAPRPSSATSYRPTHTNTSWEAAKFEVVRPPLRARRASRAGASRSSTTRRTATTSPGTARDGARHDDHGAAVAAAGPALPRPGDRPGRAPLPLRAGAGRDDRGRGRGGYGSTCRAAPDAGAAVAPLVTVDNDAVVEAVKLADDRSGDVVVRLYEAHGGRVRPGSRRVRPARSPRPAGAARGGLELAGRRCRCGCGRSRS